MDNLHTLAPLGGYEKSWDDLSACEVSDQEIVSLACAMGQEKTFAGHFKKHFGKPLPKPGKVINIKGGHCMWTAPDQYWLFLNGENTDADREVAERFDETAYVTLQTDGWAQVNLSGPRALDMLERFAPLDIASFKIGDATRTRVHHLAMVIARINKDEYRLISPRSSAGSFIHAIEETAQNISALS